MGCKEDLEAYLREQGIPFEMQHHTVAYTAQEVAASDGEVAYEFSGLGAGAHHVDLVASLAEIDLVAGLRRKPSRSSRRSRTGTTCPAEPRRRSGRL